MGAAGDSLVHHLCTPGTLWCGGPLCLPWLVLAEQQGSTPSPGVSPRAGRGLVPGSCPLFGICGVKREAGGGLAGGAHRPHRSPIDERGS